MWSTRFCLALSLSFPQPHYVSDRCRQCAHKNIQLIVDINNCAERQKRKIQLISTESIGVTDVLIANFVYSFVRFIRVRSRSCVQTSTFVRFSLSIDFLICLIAHRTRKHSSNRSSVIVRCVQWAIRIITWNSFTSVSFWTEKKTPEKLSLKCYSSHGVVFYFVSLTRGASLSFKQLK